MAQAVAGITCSHVLRPPAYSPAAALSDGPAASASLSAAPAGCRTWLDHPKPAASTRSSTGRLSYGRPEPVRLGVARQRRRQIH